MEFTLTLEFTFSSQHIKNRRTKITLCTAVQFSTICSQPKAALVILYTIIDFDAYML